jgi:ketosteroid isomerase-like protein
MKTLLSLFTVIAFYYCDLNAQKLVNIRDKKAKEIIAVMHEQEKNWNKMDFEGFMQGYWKSDSLQFIGKSGITYGWKKTLNNYKKHYPDKASAGILNFTILYIEGLSSSSAYVIGKWHLSREKGDIEGYYTLLWRKIKKRWVIVADHTN